MIVGRLGTVGKVGRKCAFFPDYSIYLYAVVYILCTRLGQGGPRGFRYVLQVTDLRLATCDSRDI